MESAGFWLDYTLDILILFLHNLLCDGNKLIDDR